MEKENDEFLGGLSDEAILYRFVSFFDLYDILIRQRLRYSKLATMDDENEGLGVALKHQANPIFRYTAQSQERLVEIQDYALNNHYISCWTTEPNAMAMWLLYSSNKSAIRISTTVKKLKKVTEQCFNNFNWSHHTDLAGSREFVTWYFKVDSVRYIDYAEFHEKSNTRNSNFYDAAREKERSQPGYFSSQDWLGDFSNFVTEELLTANDGLFLKDRSFFHEKEVRACLYCGVRNDLTLEEFKRRGRPINQNLFSSAEKDELPLFVYGKIASDFLDSICFDPRLPDYQRDTYLEILGKCSPKVETSHAFGSLLNLKNFSIEWD